jgi:hypothetical protein
MNVTTEIDYPQIYQDRDAFYIQIGEGYNYYRQRRCIENATDRPLSGTEEIIIALCKKILGC